jgi:hypothetical protein
VGLPVTSAKLTVKPDVLTAVIWPRSLMARTGIADEEPYVPDVTPVASMEIVTFDVSGPPPVNPAPVVIVRFEGTATAPTKSAMVVRLVTPF